MVNFAYMGGTPLNEMDEGRDAKRTMRVLYNILPEKRELNNFLK